MSTSTRELRFAWRDVARMIMRECSVTTGLWKIGVGLRFGVGNAGPNDAEIMPTAIVSVDALVLTEASAPGPLVFSAEELMAESASSSAPAPASGAKKAAKTASRARKVRG